MIHEEMMGIFASKDPCDSPPGLSFDPDNPTEITAGGSEVLAIIGGVAPYTFEILQTSFFLFNAADIAWPPAYSDTYIKATTYFDANKYPHFAMDPTLARNDVDTGNQWQSGEGEKNEHRFNVDLGSAKIVQQLLINNGHRYGINQFCGVKNFVLQGSNDASSLAQLDYSDDTYWTTIQSGLQALEHIDEDWEHPQIFNITNSTAYRYYSLKIADNWGSNSYITLRHLQFHTTQNGVYITTTSDLEVTVNAPSYAHFTVRVKCTDACDQVANAFLYYDGGPWDLQYTGGTAGPFTDCGETDFRVIQNGCMLSVQDCNTDGKGFQNITGLDCSAYGGGTLDINVAEHCAGGVDCDSAGQYQASCWPFPS